MIRDEVLRLMREARTADEVEQALRVVENWIKAHPDDWPISREAEGLLMLQDALEE